MIDSFDVIVVGGGHAGCEAAAAAANMNTKVLLISTDITKFGQMSCNPAIGGIAKGQIVREIDALGGLTGIITDRSSIQFRMLNLSKGPAMWSPRAQCDRMKFSSNWREQLEGIQNLFLWQDTVIDLIVEDNIIKGVTTNLGMDFLSKSVILTNGTFLSGRIHVGDISFAGGRAGEGAVFGLTQKLQSMGFETGRMKTGTPVRIDGRSINFSMLGEQKPDEVESYFSFLTTGPNQLKKRSCYTTYTSTFTHDILREGFEKSPLFKGTIQGIGHRYCPSIEDKIRTFYEKDSHLLFLEPEGETTYEMYLNGFSSSLPADIQYRALKSLTGFEKAIILRPGYAIEYDFFQPTQLHHTLETKLIKNLFFAGQINGTTGYEEAAAQGLMAGINAALLVNEKEPLVLGRNQAYIGVLIDDLVTKGVDEPYRMFTSRAEHRISIRQDNADLRLTNIGFQVGLAMEERILRLEQKKAAINNIVSQVNKTSITPNEINSTLEKYNTTPISQKKKLRDILLRPEIRLYDLQIFISALQDTPFPDEQLKLESLEASEIAIKYSGYIEREALIADKFSRLDHIAISPNFDYSILNSISTEARQKLARIMPKTIGQAKRIPGVSPSDINILLVYFGR